MAPLVSIAIKIAALTFVFGQLARATILNFNFPLLDPIIICLAILSLFDRQKSLNLSHPWWKFIAYSWVVLLVNLILLNSFSLPPLLYLIRLTSLLILIITPPKITPKNLHFLDFCLISLVIFGLIQYFIWPDLTFMTTIDWDPHLNRLVASFFDPTFTAIIYLFFLLRLTLNPSKTKLTYLAIFLTYIAFALTYNRSGFLSLFVVSVFISNKLAQPKIIIFTTIVILSTLILLPQKAGEGNRLNRISTITAKLENYHQGIELFRKSPIFGIGYNTIGLYRPEIKPTSHAKWGFDGSFLNIAISTGLIGFLLFLSGLFFEYKASNLLSQSILICLLVHSIFSNSFLFPWTLLYFSLTKYRN
jgi:hypothetical protein